MEIDKINHSNYNPNFNAKISVEPEVLKRLIGKDYDKAQGTYIGLFDFQYSPLEQRKIIYNIIKHIKKDKTHKAVKIGGGWSCGMLREHVWMMVDGVMGNRWNSFRRYSADSVRPDYVQRILNYAKEIYPKTNFEKVNVFDKISSIFGSKNEKSAYKEYEKLAKKIEKLVEK